MLLRYAGDLVGASLNMPMMPVMVAMMLVLLMQASPVHAERFACAFLQEQYPLARATEAACAMLPEHTYSTKCTPPRRQDQTTVGPGDTFEDLVDVTVDTDKQFVSWKRHFGLTDEAVIREMALLQAAGLSAEEAEQRAAFQTRSEERFRIISYLKSSTTVPFDGVTGQLFVPPKQVPEHTLILANAYSLFYLYIPEVSGQALLLRPTAWPDASWVNIHPGTCTRMK